VQATPRNEAMLAVVGMDPVSRPTMSRDQRADILATGWCGRGKSSASWDNFISEVTACAGDLVVTSRHGIGRFAACRRCRSPRAPRLSRTALCRRNKLFLPVENIELLSRYGSDHANVELDRLGAAAAGRAGQLKNPSARSPVN